MVATQNNTVDHVDSYDTRHALDIGDHMEVTIHSNNNVIQKPCSYTLPIHQQRYLSAPDLGHRYQIRYKWLRILYLCPRSEALR